MVTLLGLTSPQAPATAPQWAVLGGTMNEVDKVLKEIRAIREKLEELEKRLKDLSKKK